MIGRRPGVPRPRRGGDAVLRADRRMRPGTIVGCCVSLLVAGVLFARGFIGVLPGRPVYLLLGGLLAGTALFGLVVDHIAVLVRPEHPDEVLVAELDRSRRHGLPLTLVAVRCSEAVGLDVVGRLRTTDRAWRTRGTLHLLLVGTGPPGSAAFAARLTSLVPAEDVRCASFPADAVTADQLYARLEAGQERPAEVGPGRADAPIDAARLAGS